MLQVALGGYYLISSESSYFDDSPVYYEPGFTNMVPLEIEVPVCDLIYVLVAKREDGTGESYVDLDEDNLEISVKDVTVGEDIPAFVMANTINNEWDDNPSPTHYPVVASITNSINITEETVRVRILDCYIKDTTDNDFISFRLTVSDENKNFSYIPVTISKLFDRPSNSALGRSPIVYMNNLSDLYVLVSPYAYLYEVAKGESYDFSYPLNTIYYKRQKTYNDEGFIFSLGSVSDEFVSDNVSVINVPGYDRVGVVHIDRYMYKKLEEKEETAYLYVNIVGKLSEISDSFRIILAR